MRRRRKAVAPDLIAYHVAAHAVVAFHEGAEFSQVSCDTAENSEGHPMFGHNLGYQRDAIEAHARALLAGRLAELRHSPEACECSIDEADQHSVEECAAWLVSPSDHDCEEAAAWIALWTVQTRHFIDRVWHQIEAVATTLASERALSWAQVETIIKTARTSRSVATPSAQPVRRLPPLLLGGKDPR